MSDKTDNKPAPDWLIKRYTTPGECGSCKTLRAKLAEVEAELAQIRKDRLEDLRAYQELHAKTEVLLELGKTLVAVDALRKETP